MTGSEFNDYFEITCKKDTKDFKIGQKLCFKDDVLIVTVSKLPKILNDGQIQKARELYHQGKSYRYIGKMLNVSHMTVYGVLNTGDGVSP
jgi:DNA invertase Pin-like site-specific DNA recombinase